MTRNVRLVLSAVLIATACSSGEQRSNIPEPSDRVRLPSSLFYGGTVDVPSHRTYVPLSGGTTVENGRTSVNLSETSLAPANVNTQFFGKLFVHNVDNAPYAQPLYVANVPVANAPSAPRNVVYVATMNNTVYAFDADNPGEHWPLWQVSLGQPVPPSMTYNDCRNIGNQVGITSTPAIDLSRNLMYLVTKECTGSCASDSYVHYYLHQVDITNGTDLQKIGFSDINFGSGTGNIEKVHNQRPAITLIRNPPGSPPGTSRVYVAFGSNCDDWNYWGRIFEFDVTGPLTQTNVKDMIDPNGTNFGAGIWQSGNGPPVDANGNLYFQTGNTNANSYSNHCTGTELPAAVPYDFGDQLIKLTHNAASLDVTDRYFPPGTPGSDGTSILCQDDLDFGSSGPVLLPAPGGGPGWNLIGGGKDGTLQSWNLNNGIAYHTNSLPVTDKAMQPLGSVDKTLMKNIHGAPVYWDGPNGRMGYIWPEESPLTTFTISSGGVLGSSSLVGHTAANVPIYDPVHTFPASETWMPGGFLAVSANQSVNGIVWASVPASGDALTETRPGRLYAFDAATLQELWDSDMVSADKVCGFAKNVPPIVVNGQVHMALFNYQNGNSDGVATFGPKCAGVCGAGQQCIHGQCRAASTCGDGYCSQFENAQTCPQDCAGLQGCYSDGSPHLMALIGTGYNIETCRAAAANLGYQFAALQWHDQCFAGQGVVGTLLPDSSCDTPCNSNLDEGCGGYNANRIFTSCTGGTSWCAHSGSCTLPQNCCVPLTCAAQGATCGTISNGCGGTVNCGGCTAPQTCGGGGAANTCGCTATNSCAGKTCGTVGNGCGFNLNCGTCAAGWTCNSNQCVAPPPFQCSSCTCGCNTAQTACLTRSCPLHEFWDDSVCACTQ